MWVLVKHEVESLLDLDALRAVVGAALADLSAGRASMPTRIAAVVPERDGLLAAMPAYLPGAGALTTKLVSLSPVRGTTIAPGALRGAKWMCAATASLESPVTSSV